VLLLLPWIVAAWPSLPEPIRRAMLALIGVEPCIRGGSQVDDFSGL
jgi:hypothetical protein